MRERLHSLPVEIRRDVGTVLRVAVRECPRRWSRTGGVQNLWVILPGSGVEDDGTVLLRRPAPGALSGYRYADDIGTGPWVFNPDVDGELPGNRCVALLHGNGWRSWRFPFMTSADNAVVINGRHHSGARFHADIAFTATGRVFRRIRFDPEVHLLLDENGPGH